MTLTGRDVLFDNHRSICADPRIDAYTEVRHAEICTRRRRGAFLERLKYIPSQTEVLSAPTLAAGSPTGRTTERSAYTSYPVLFPLESFFCLPWRPLGFASGALADGLGFLSNIPGLDLVDFPRRLYGIRSGRRHRYRRNLQVAYRADEGWFRLLSALTAIKLATVSAAIGQVAFLGALNGLLFFFPASKAI